MVRGVSQRQGVVASDEGERHKSGTSHKGNGEGLAMARGCGTG